MAKNDASYMDPQELASVGETLYGKWGWQTALARDLSVDGSTVRRWKSGHSAITLPQAERIRAMRDKFLAEKEGETHVVKKNVYRDVLMTVADALSLSSKTIRTDLEIGKNPDLTVYVKIAFVPFGKQNMEFLLEESDGFSKLREVREWIDAELG